MVADADCLSRVKGNLHARFLGEGGQRCSTLTRQITLVWKNDSITSEGFFGDKIFKLVSILASMTTAYFNKQIPDFLPEKSSQMACFDCRIWQVPNLNEAVNCLYWRELDATRNSITMAAQAVYSHKQLHKKNTKEMMDLLMAKGINWNDYLDCCKKGTYFKRVKVLRPFTTAELERLPEKHEARQNPDLEVERTEYQELSIPPLSKIQNKLEVLFDVI